MTRISLNDGVRFPGNVKVRCLSAPVSYFPNSVGRFVNWERERMKGNEQRPLMSSEGVGFFVVWGWVVGLSVHGTSKYIDRLFDKGGFIAISTRLRITIN
jgi:hypothetical protein